MAAEQAAAPAEAQLRTHSIEVGGRTVKTYLIGDAPAGPAAAAPAPAKTAASQPAAASKTPAKGKTLRTDLVLHTR